MKNIISSVCDGCPYLNDSRYCKKIDGNVDLYGSCETEEAIDVGKTYSNPRKLNRYDRNKKYKRKLINLARKNIGKWFPPAFPVNENGDWTDNIEEMYRIKRLYRGSRSKYLKKMSNKKLRRFKGNVSNHGGYRKVYDLWWEMY